MIHALLYIGIGLAAMAIAISFFVGLVLYIKWLFEAETLASRIAANITLVFVVLGAAYFLGFQFVTGWGLTLGNF